jgi:hypothetical protein
MHLVPCASPEVPLENAPRTALLADLTEGESWEGFWAADSYLVLCTRSTGEVEWFRLADDDQASLAEKSAKAAGRKSAKDSTRVLMFPTLARSPRQTRVVIAKSPDGRRMLVGTAGRAARTNITHGSSAPRSVE